MDEKRTSNSRVGSARRARANEKPDPLIGQTLVDRYEIVSKLGEGGMGAVYLATHTLLEKQVALKVLHGELGRKPELVERFIQEAKAASRIRHENVIDVSDFGATPDGHVFFAMELLDGSDLHDLIMRTLRAGELLPWARSKKIFLQICAALAAAHRSGIIHRDLKPENIYLVEFLGERDFVKLLDFGVAKLTEAMGGDRKLTQTGVLFGTAEYMSPEQARGDEIDHRVDIYAMGCILFQLVTGHVPFEAPNFMAALALHLVEPPPTIPPEVFDQIGAPRALAAVIERALDKEPDQRFQTIDELASAVRAACGDPGAVEEGRAQSAPAPVEVAQPSAGQLATAIPEDEAWADRPRRSRLALILAGVAVMGVAAAVTVLVARSGVRGTPRAQPGEPGGLAAAETVPVPAPTEVPLPADVTVKLDSQPRGAIVKDLASGVVYGATPQTFSLAPGRTPRVLSLSLRGYADKVFELIPDRATIERVEVLARPPPDDDCPELPCLKSDPTRTKIP